MLAAHWNSGLDSDDNDHVLILTFITINTLESMAFGCNVWKLLGGIEASRTDLLSRFFVSQCQCWLV